MPTRRRHYFQLHWIRFVIDDVHEDRAAIEIRMARIELRESSGQIVTKNLVTDRHGVAIHGRDPPGLVVNARHRKSGHLALRFARTNAAEGLKLLHILSEIKHRVTAGRPSWHLKIQRLR